MHTEIQTSRRLSSPKIKTPLQTQNKPISENGNKGQTNQQKDVLAETAIL